MKQSASPFQILEILGEGSFGTVCVARVTEDPLRRKVALKILKGSYASNTKILNRTRDEARLLSRLNHPNIVRVERLMDIGGRPVVVMEHVQGASLDQLLARNRNGLPANVAIEIIRQTAKALHVAYSEALSDAGKPLRVIHRDIKPSNIILSIHGEVKVVDFGIARGEFEGREAETESVVMGSRPYMAPERLDGIADNPSVDVYSLGMSLFELLTGRTMSLSINPVSHDQALNRHLRHVELEGCDEVAEDQLRDLIRRMCSYTREYRPSSMEVAETLSRLQQQLPDEVTIGLGAYASTVVVPLYENRPRYKPEDAVQGNTDSDFLRDVTDALGESTTLTDVGVRRLAPYAFLTFLSFALMLVVALVVAKYLVNEGSFDSVGANAALMELGDDVRVKVWLPSDAQAQIGQVFLPTAGHVRVPAGATLMQLFFDDGRVLTCTFEAQDGISVRTVMDAGRYGLSVDDGDVLSCNEIRPATATVDGDDI